MNNTNLVGNLVRDPKLTYSSENKTPITRFTIAVNEGQGDKEKTHFVPVTAFGTLAENVSDSLRKGMRAIVIGRLDTYSKPVEIDGEEKNITMVGFIASAAGPDLRWAVAKVAKVERADDDKPAVKAEPAVKAAPADDEAGEDVAAPEPARRSTARARATAAKPAAAAAAAADDDDDF